LNRIDGKFAVITGGTQGLGAAIARNFAEVGAKGLVTCGRSSEKGQIIADAISNETGCPVHFVTADLTRVLDCRTVIAAADKHFGRIDVLVNAAGLTDRGDILNTTEELFDRLFAVNTRGPYFLMQDSLKIMLREKTEGSIVNIGSTSALAGQPFISAYCASKGALATLTRNSAFAVMRNKIRINQLNIGWMASEGEHQVQTQFHDAPENWLERVGPEQPFERLLAPEEVARAVTFLASDDAGMMTGSIINFDQSVWGAYSFGPPTPESPMSL
jgi:NAD(P)-dependent dehydrogenase (short-subunit alcohol dehydrogenase family)